MYSYEMYGTLGKHKSKCAALLKNSVHILVA